MRSVMTTQIKDGKKTVNILTGNFTLKGDSETLKFVCEMRFAEARDRWFRELEQLEKERMFARETFNRGVYEDTFDRWCHALRMYDRFYVLADLQQKGKLDIKRGW